MFFYAKIKINLIDKQFRNFYPRPPLPFPPLLPFLIPPPFPKLNEVT